MSETPLSFGDGNPLEEGLESTRKAPPGVIVVMGASGDLTSRKLLPALERLSSRGLLPQAFAVVGVARTQLDDEGFRQLMIKAAPDPGPGWSEIVKHSRYVSGDYVDEATFAALRTTLEDLESEIGAPGNRTFYLATVPAVFEEVAAGLGSAGLNKPAKDGAAVRLVIEKPFGRDLESARHLDTALHKHFEESQIYRIDHY
ncbi:MAG TPA: hypothetical protein VNF71_10100, partial [Acidimicrobiales bacterium]|nr:hypothetical protein [Acidimicrobiales bacterium]